MQSKVSIVIPCYNKEKYIDKMFDSILIQRWDNVELILVNDGSTDRTRDIIFGYEQKFIERGFEIVIIDQENKGLPTAVYEGFKRITGDYVCQVDADDELDTEYISTLAGFLDENQDYDWVVCDMLSVYDDKESKITSFCPTKCLSENLNIIEMFLLCRINLAVHEYMVRVDYLKKCNLLDFYYYDTRRTQEPQFVLPLALGGGKLKHIPEALYRYVQNESMMSIKRTVDDIVKYYTDFNTIVRDVIKHIVTDENKKNRYLTLAEIGKYKIIYGTSKSLENYDTNKVRKQEKTIIKFINSIFKPSPCLSYDCFDDYQLLFTAVIDCIYHEKPKQVSATHDRIIAWGSLGRNAQRLLPKLKGTRYEPTDYWDITGDGVTVKKPDKQSIRCDDIILIFPINNAAKSILTELEGINCRILQLYDISTLIMSIEFPALYQETCFFSPENICEI